MARGHFLPYHRAQAIVRKFRLKSRQEWRGYVRTHKDELKALGIPALPEVHYLSEETKYRLYRYKMPSASAPSKPQRWTGWTAWLGIGLRPAKSYMSKTEFVDFLRGHGIKNKDQYVAWRREHKTHPQRHLMPAAPQLAYQGFSWRTALGKRVTGAGNVARQFTPFRELKREVQALAKREGLSKKESWLEYVRAHPEWLQEHRCPVRPDIAAAYDADWRGWDDFLGNDRRPRPTYKRV